MQRMALADLSGKVAIVTGGTSGIGYETAKQLAANGAHVILAARNMKKGKEMAAIIQHNSPRGSRVEAIPCEMTSFTSIHSFVNEFHSKNVGLHILVNNAGVENPPDGKSEQGFDVTMATNYLGPFYLTHLLLSTLSSSAPSRVVFVSSMSEAHGTVDWKDLGGASVRRSNYRMYANSKVCITMLCQELQRRLEGTGVDCFSAHPGICKTSAVGKSDKSKPSAIAIMLSAMTIGITQDRGAIPLIYTATDPQLQGDGGAAFTYGPYYNLIPYPYNFFGLAGGLVPPLPFFDPQGKRTPQNPLVHDAAACQRLYEATKTLINQSVPKALQLS